LGYCLALSGCGMRLRDPAARCARVVQETAPRKIRGRRECRVRAAPAVSCATCTKENAHEHTGQRRHFGIPCAMALRLMPRSPRRRIRLVTVVSGLKVLRNPVGLTKTSADLTPATGARTTRFCRTRLRRSSCAPWLAHGKPPCEHLRARRCRVHRIPSRVRDDGQRPSCRERMGQAGSADLPDGKSEIFFRGGLDRANHVDPVR
jgi:hypothetical protein